MTRKCGSCRECCIVLDVEPVGSPRDEPCPHVCAAGCAIYANRPESCKTFTCAWLEGQLSINDQPNKTHMTIWASKLVGVGEQSLPVIQCNVTKGHKRHKKTMRWLLGASFTFPVQVIQQDRCELFNKGKSVVEWNEGDFIRFDYENGDIIGAKVIPQDEVLTTDEDREKWEQAQANSIEVIETDPEFRAAQLARNGERI